MEDIGKIQEKIENIIQRYDAGVKTLFEQLDKIVNSGNISHDTPQANKKKTKRLSIIADTESEDSVISEKDLPISKVADKISENEVEYIKPQERKTSSRPVRAAKLKIENCLKEKPLNHKMRRPSESDISSNKTSTKIKQEKRSNSSEATQLNATKPTTEGIKRKSNETNITTGSNDVEEEPSKKVDESLVLLNNNELATVELSDDEVEKMPPPVVIPKKRNARRKAASVGKKSDIVKPNEIKVEKQSIDNKTQEQTIDSNASQANLGNIKKEKVSDVEISGRQEVIREPQTKGKKARKQKHRPIKEEKSDEGDLSEAQRNCVEVNKVNSIEKEDARHSTRKKQASVDSVYEDAISENQCKEKEKTLNDNGKINKKISNTKSTLSHEVEYNPERAADATFLSAVDAPFANPSPNNGSLQCPQSTFVMDKESNTPNSSNAEKKEDIGISPQINQTFGTNIVQTTFVMNKGDNQASPQILDTNNVQSVPSACNDATFRVNTSSDQKQEQNQKHEDRHNSILTEDDSEEEYVPLPKPSVKVKTKNELFNPFIESPVKKKVEAFEKHAYAMNGSPQQRQTRTKTRAKTTKENKEPQSNVITISKTTPNLARNTARLLTPTQQILVTSTNNSALKKAPTSASKLVFPKVVAKSSTATKIASLSRDSSAEDTKRGVIKLQLEEKKKKREQKQQMATQTREAKEKQRAEKLKKTMEEREERVRRKAIETEQKRQLEEINRNLKLQEEKREAQKRLEKQKQLEMAEAAKKEREMLEAMKIEKAKERLLQERKLLEQKKIAKKAQNPAYDFHMLNSDDSTDDEGKTSSKRPPPPTWSKSAIRQLIMERQTNLPTKIIDSFFSLQPMTPDLRQIFPKIDSRYLKRNSSVFWRTPPRYSQLPKY